MLEGNEPTESRADREITIERVFDARPELVFEAWTSAEHLARWWGPTGFTITTRAFEFKVGGVWLFTMHGPDGTDFPNRIVYEEIVRPRRIVCSNYGGNEGGPAEFQTSVTFAPEAGKTRVTLRSLFPSVERRNHVVEHYHAIEGGKQTLARLAVEVAELGKRPAFRTSRTFTAPKRRVFEAWSKPEHLSKFLPPDGFVMARCEMDFRVGGVLSFSFTGPDGAEARFDGHYIDIEAGSRIVFGGTVHGLTTTTTLLFAESGDETTLEVEQIFSEESLATRGAPIGWGQTLDHLAALLRGE